MKTVYIASAYRIGDQAINVRRSIMVANELLDHGFAPYVPLLSHFWHIITPRNLATWTRLDNEWLLRSDCILRIAGESVGADAEVALANEEGIPVFYSIRSIVKWAKSQEGTKP